MNVRKKSEDELIAIVSTGRNAIARAKAASALGFMGAKKAVPVLIDALGDRHALVRMLAAQSLGRLGAKRALAALKSASKLAVDEPYRVTFREAIRACSK